MIGRVRAAELTRVERKREARDEVDLIGGGVAVGVGGRGRGWPGDCAVATELSLLFALMLELDWES